MFLRRVQVAGCTRILQYMFDSKYSTTVSPRASWRSDGYVGLDLLALCRDVFGYFLFECFEMESLILQI